MNARLQHWLWTFLRLALCAAAVGYVAWRTDFHDKVWLAGQDGPVRLVRLGPAGAEVEQGGQARFVETGWLQVGEDGRPRISFGLASLASRSSKGLLLLAILMYGIQPLLQVVRFRWMLGVQGLEVGWGTALKVCLVGNFYSYVIPGTTGGDIIRAGYVMRGNTNRHGALVGIALDRLTGMAGVFALASLAGLLLADQEPVVRYAAWMSGLAFAGMVAGFAAITGWPGVTRLLGRLPLGEHLQKLYEAASVGRRSWPVLLAAVGLTVVLQSGSMAAFSVAAVALGMEPAWSTYFVCLPVSLVVASLPITPQGLGTMEVTMMALLAGRVGSPSQVLGLAVAMRIIGLIWALPGGLVPLLRPVGAEWSSREQKAEARE